MNIKKIIAIYFSPNGSTREIVKKLARGFGEYEIEEIDWTSLEMRSENIQFNKDELVVIGFPVYGGRLPSISEEALKSIRGNNTPTVAIVSYGNRDYEDALLELKEGLKASKMKVISAAAIIGQHCLNNNVAKGRPDKRDEIKILEYAKKVSNKINNILDIEGLADLSVNGEYPYNPIKSSRTPQGDELCIQCGICETECPVKAINKKNFRNTDSNICIFCGHCISICPTNARDIKDESFINSMKKLEEIAKDRREIEIFMD